MWRTIIVSQGERITVQNGNIRVACGESESFIPLADIYAVVIDNRAALISVNALELLAQSGAHVFFCDEKHTPVSVALPLNTHYQPLAVIKRQLAMTEDEKDILWQRLVQAKIFNQARCLQFAGVKSERVTELLALAENVLPGDKKGLEAVAAKKYFQALFGYGFSRRSGGVLNAALNYGYAILRSSVAKTLTAYGYNCVLGLHHRSEKNAFNLADDIMEPFRPAVDLWADEHNAELFEELTKQNRKELVNLPNEGISIAGKTMRLRNAIDVCVNSLTGALQRGQPSSMYLPELLPCGIQVDED